MLGSSFSEKVFSNLKTYLENRGESIPGLLLSDFLLSSYHALILSRPFTLPVSAAAELKLSTEEPGV
jgi:hypothetical protein